MCFHPHPLILFRDDNCPWSGRGPGQRATYSGSTSADLYDQLLMLVMHALIYMLPSITKKGVIESTLAPLVVLVIHANIHIVGLMFLSSKFQISSALAWQGLGMWTLQNAKNMDWQKLKTLHFWFSDPRSHWVHRKANTVKRGWGFVNDLFAQVLNDIAPKP